MAETLVTDPKGCGRAAPTHSLCGLCMWWFAVFSKRKKYKNLSLD